MHAMQFFTGMTIFQESMDVLRKRESVPVLIHSYFGHSFSILADAYDLSLGAALIQKDKEGQDVVVAYAGHSLHKAEISYSRRSV